MKATEIKILTVRETTAAYKIGDPGRVAAFWTNEITRSAWYDSEKEALVVLLLDGNNQVREYNLVTLGLVGQSLAHPREVFRPAIIAAATSIILAHNHPCGVIEPSAADLETTRKMIAAGEIIGIKLLDHIIIGGTGKYFSIKESEVCNF